MNEKQIEAVQQARAEADAAARDDEAVAGKARDYSLALEQLRIAEVDRLQDPFQPAFRERSEDAWREVKRSRSAHAQAIDAAEKERERAVRRALRGA